jgi:hypothetical protein
LRVGWLVLGVLLAACLNLVAGAAPAFAAVSPQPYLDTSQRLTDPLALVNNAATAARPTTGGS